MTKQETQLAEEIQAQGVNLPKTDWESCRAWLNANEWKINVLSDYPQGEVKFTIRRGFERIELSGHSDLEVMLKAILEIKRRDSFNS